jgi:hypothetical protein
MAVICIELLVYIELQGFLYSDDMDRIAGAHRIAGMHRIASARICIQRWYVQNC